MNRQEQARRDAVIVRQARSGVPYDELAARWDLTASRVGQIVRDAGLRARDHQRPRVPTWPDGTPMHELQIVLLRVFAMLPKPMTKPERDAVIGAVGALLRAYYPEPDPYSRRQVLAAAGVGL